MADNTTAAARRPGLAGRIFNPIREGRSVSVDFFVKNAWYFILLVVILLGLIGLRYNTKGKMARIRDLNKELDRMESLKLQEKSGYMSLIRETQMKEMVDRNHLGLEFQEQPPYELELDR